MSDTTSDSAPVGGAEDAPRVEGTASESAPTIGASAETTRLPSVEDSTRETRPLPQTPIPQAGAPQAPAAPRNVWAQRPAQAPVADPRAPRAPRAGIPGLQGASPLSEGGRAPNGRPGPQQSAPQGAPRPPLDAPAGSAWWSQSAQNAQNPVGGSPSPVPPSSRTALAEKRGPSWLALLLAMLLTAALTLTGAWALLAGRSTARPVEASSTPKASSTVEPVASKGDSPDWQAVAKAVSPATVTISVTSNSSSGVGSGVVYDSKGDIVTNYHVISSALDGQGRISVTLADGRIYEAEIVGHDQTTDLAVIRLKNAPSDLTVATFGSSSDLAVGQQVMAVGAPLGLSNTVTTGIISALNRPVEVSTSESKPQQVDPNDPFGQLPQLQGRTASTSESVITNAIQVDASINPGNSGGPLFDSTGRVIGINSSIASNSGSSDTAGSIGLGFAIPANLASSVADQLIATGAVDHAVLGVSVTTGTAKADDSQVAGAEIAQVTPGGSAEDAGLRVGDVITAVDGDSVSSSKQLTGYIRRYKGGDAVKIQYVRNGKKYEVDATLKSAKG